MKNQNIESQTENENQTTTALRSSARPRVGKIARLPGLIRNELNERMEEGEPSDTLLEWINDLSETQQIIACSDALHPQDFCPDLR